jgi:hypothetical protein
MFLKKLAENRLLVINYDKNGLVETCRGHLYKINLIEQTLSLKDEQQKIYSIRLYDIKEIN